MHNILHVYPFTLTQIHEHLPNPNLRHMFTWHEMTRWFFFSFTFLSVSDRFYLLPAIESAIFSSSTLSTTPPYAPCCYIPKLRSFPAYMASTALLSLFGINISMYLVFIIWRKMSWGGECFFRVICSAGCLNTMCVYWSFSFPCSIGVLQLKIVSVLFGSHERWHVTRRVLSYRKAFDVLFAFTLSSWPNIWNQGRSCLFGTFQQEWLSPSNQHDLT